MEANSLTSDILNLEFASLFQRIRDENIYEYSQIDLEEPFLGLFKEYISNLYLTSFSSLKNSYSSLVEEILIENNRATLFLIDTRDSEFRIKISYRFLKSDFVAVFIYKDRKNSFSCTIVDNDCQTSHYQYLYPEMDDSSLNSILQISILADAHVVNQIRYSFKKSRNGIFGYLSFIHDGPHIYKGKGKLTGQLVTEQDSLLSIDHELEIKNVFHDLHDLDNFLFFCDHYPLFSSYLNEYENHHQFSMEDFLELYSEFLGLKEKSSIVSICRMQII